MSQQTANNDIRRDLVALLPRLRRFALTLTGTAKDADDLVRSVAARAIQKSHHWKGKGRLENWLFSMTRSAWADEAKRRRTRPGAHVEPAEGSETSAITPLLTMPEGLASTFLLVDVEGFSYSEAADILGVSAEILSTRLCAARLQLAALGSRTTERRA